MKIPVGRVSRLASVVSIAVALLYISGASSSSLPSYTGTLGTDNTPPGLQGSGLWMTSGVSQIVWSIGERSWNYDYSFAVPDSNISHLIIECALDMEFSELSNVTGDFTSFSLGTLTPPEPNNPNLPGTIHGIYFADVGTTAGGFHFHSTRAPVWGNFYAVDGSVNTAWNTGFLLPNPTDPPFDGSLSYKILVPDSVVPDASTIVLACFGALQLLAVRKKIFR